jgi:hypothetical protein
MILGEKLDVLYKYYKGKKRVRKAVLLMDMMRIGCTLSNDFQVL